MSRRTDLPPPVEPRCAWPPLHRVEVIASGGISGLKDLQALDKAGGVEGVIVGRALYEGALADEVCGWNTF